MILNLLKRHRKPEGRDLLDPTPRPAVDWIIANNERPLTTRRIGRINTPEGRIAIIDPMVHIEGEFIDVPTTGCDMVHFRDSDGMPSKLALVFADAPVAWGRRVSWCAVDSVSIAPVTPTTLEALNRYQADIGPDASLYEHFFEQFACEDAPDARLPSGAHLPYIVAPDDGSYPVCELRSAGDDLVAVFIDLMGRSEEYQDWLIPREPETT